jgi:hypothetical protein
MAREVRLRTRGPAVVAGKRRLGLRDELFPELAREGVWDRTTFTGFTTVPRTMPLLMRIIDGLSIKKAGRVYFDLWCRAFDDFFVDIRDEYEFAYASGYSGQRAIRSWRERMLVLAEHRFILINSTSFGRIRYAAIRDPHRVVQELTDEQVSSEDLLALRSTMLAIGATAP